MGGKRAEHVSQDEVLASVTTDFDSKLSYRAFKMYLEYYVSFAFYNELACRIFRSVSGAVRMSSKYLLKSC